MKHDKEGDEGSNNRGRREDEFTFIELSGVAETLEDRLFDEVIDNFRLPWRSFEEARAFVHGFNFNTQKEWYEYSKSGNRPTDIPANPHLAYKDKGWASWGDWLGTGNIATFNKQFRSFKEARAFVHKLGLKSQADWYVYCKSGNKPTDIPANPHRIYKGKGWISLGDWLGTGNVASYNKQFRSFKEARAFAQGLKISSQPKWKQYAKSGEKPTDIPGCPNAVYKEWISWGDWLGTGNIATFNKQFMAFEDARTFARNLHLTSSTQWEKYSKSGKRSHDIPSNPAEAYKDKGWTGWGDWLGTGNIAPFNRQFMAFEDARTFARNLHLTSQKEWCEYSKNGEKPTHIPANPSSAYKDKGWTGWGDWLVLSHLLCWIRIEHTMPFKKGVLYAQYLA